MRVGIARLAATLLFGTLGIAQPSEPPNFIIILTDDQGYGDLGVYGSPYIRTPNIDRMAAEGIRFTDFYAQPFCGPSRAALVTGSYPPRNSLMFNHLPRARTGIHPNEITLAELLKTKGYATTIIGKWHLGDAPRFLPTRNGFDSYYGLPYSNDMWPFHPKVLRTGNDDPVKTAIRKRAEMTGYQGQGQTYSLDWFPSLPLIEDDEVIALNPDQSKLTHDYTGRALEFIEDNRERPFFLYLAHSMPHVPLFRGREFEGRSRRGLYGDVIEEIDSGVGRILSRLRELRLDTKTLVVFMSDNGPWMHYGIDGGSAGPLRGDKGSLWEGGVRVPAVMRWPGRIPPGRVTSEIAANLDLYPTLAHLAGVEVPKDRIIDGINLWPLLSGASAASGRESFYYFAGEVFYKSEEGAPKNDPKLQAVRSGRWKLYLEAANPEDPVAAGTLYDLLSDASKRKDVASFHPDIAKRLRAMAEAFGKDLRKHIRPLGRLTAADGN